MAYIFGYNSAIFNNPKFTEQVTKTVSNFFESGIISDALKTVKVPSTNIQDGAKTYIENYRPISILTSSSKIYEKLMHKRLVDFLEKNTTIYENQYDFRAGRSCEHALLNAQNTLTNTMNKK